MEFLFFNQKKEWKQLGAAQQSPQKPSLMTGFQIKHMMIKILTMMMIMMIMMSPYLMKEFQMNHHTLSAVLGWKDTTHDSMDDP